MRRTTSTMRRDVSPKIVVGPVDTMPDVLARLRTATGGPATIAIPASSSLFLTASEFRALKAASEAARILLTVETDDRLRRQLATMFHIPVVDLLPSAVTELPAAETLPEDEPPPAPEPVVERARPVPPPFDPRKDIDPDETEAEVLPSPTEKRPFPIPGRVLAIAAGALALLLVLALGLAFLLQTATLELTLKRTPVNAEVTFGVVSAGARPLDGAAFTLTGAPVTYEVTFTDTIPVSGEVRTPDQIASGSVALRNPGDAPVEIAAGTTFTDRLGVAYQFVDAVDVPAAANGAAGKATAAIRAAAGGESANRDAGMLSGRLDSGVYYSNRDAAVTGGTDVVQTVVAQADIDQLVARAGQQLPELARTQALPDGRMVIPGSVAAGQLAYATTRQVGDLADTIAIDAKMTVSAIAYSVADADAQAAAQLASSLQANTPGGFELVPDTVVYQAPVLVNDQGNAALFRLPATSDSRPVLTDARKDEIAHAVAGTSPDEATAYALTLPEVAAAKVASSPGFLPARVPGNADKVKVKTS